MDDGRLRVRDTEPLRRGRLAVLLRAFLYIPHAIVLGVWTLVAAVFVAIAWLALLIEGRLPTWLQRFIAAYVRYTGQVTAWFFLLSGRYPDPLHTETHPFAIELPERLRQPRPVTLFRALLAIPPLLLATALRVVLTLSAVPAWFAAVALGRTTAGLQELGTFCLRYELEALAYTLLLTARYPRLVPAESPVSPASDLPAASRR
jgi:Domain of unknown function (DUF4389)